MNHALLLVAVVIVTSIALPFLMAYFVDRDLEHNQKANNKIQTTDSAAKYDVSARSQMQHRYRG